MLTWEQWQEKSKSSLEASQILLENQKPIEAASRAYYAAYQMVTSVLIKLRLSPRGEFGNWSHHETYEISIVRNATQ
ncbi:MAG: HEPN domain-containing protein [bacterium]